MCANDNENVRLQLFVLTVKCPFSNDNPRDCPLHEIRRQSLSIRSTWVNEMRDEEIQSIYHVHVACLKEREANKGR